MDGYGIVKRPVITIWQEPKETTEGKKHETISAIADEGLYGMGIAFTGEPVNGYYPIRTFYNYTGYVREEDLKPVDLQEMMAWEEGRLFVTSGYLADIVSIPRVQGVWMLSLPGGSLVKVLEFESASPGWAMVELVDGRKGYMRNQYLRKKEFSQAGLWTGKPVQKEIVDEKGFRACVTERARDYLGIQYRWGGRSTAGIDCSGLTSESYMQCGILTYRDAKIVPGFPIHEIPKEVMLPGDLMYFPGHIAMYLGNGKYIHSTGKAGSAGVVINSLNPKNREYRRDLEESFYAAGSIF